mmetsp:Transcript_35474/g.113322  ORF Transcript_35474/g.113322 Transcript_35474/m.113322 type:complete len:291 (-) Transcript_35474:1088-1960(-)
MNVAALRVPPREIREVGIRNEDPRRRVVALPLGDDEEGHLRAAALPHRSRAAAGAEVDDVDRVVRQRLDDRLDHRQVIPRLGRPELVELRRHEHPTVHEEDEVRLALQHVQQIDRRISKVPKRPVHFPHHRCPRRLSFPRSIGELREPRHRRLFAVPPVLALLPQATEVFRRWGRRWGRRPSRERRQSPFLAVVPPVVSSKAATSDPSPSSSSLFRRRRRRLPRLFEVEQLPLLVDDLPARRQGAVLIEAAVVDEDVFLLGGLGLLAAPVRSPRRRRPVHPAADVFRTPP